MKLEVICRSNKLPAIYQNRFYSLIQREIEKASFEMKKEQGLKTTLFSFAYLFDKSIEKKCNIKLNNLLEIQDTYFELFDKQKFVIRSVNENFLKYLFTAFTYLDTFDFSEFSNFTINNSKVFIKFDKVRLISEKNIEENQIKLKTLSPILLSDSKNNELNIFNDFDLYQENFSKRCALKIHNIKKRLPYQDIKIFPVNILPSKTKIIFKNELLTFNGFSGEFILEGDYKDLDILFKVGIGSRNSQGFGMIDLI